jgi:hypothetical protein
MDMKYIKKIIFPIIIVVIAITCFWGIRKYNYDTGKDNGYIAGYAIGYGDPLHSTSRNSQILAKDVCPYDFGSSKWKGFMMGFPAGYEAAQLQRE